MTIRSGGNLSEQWLMWLHFERKGVHEGVENKDYKINVLGRLRCKKCPSNDNNSFVARLKQFLSNAPLFHLEDELDLSLVASLTSPALFHNKLLRDESRNKPKTEQSFKVFHSDGVGGCSSAGHFLQRAPLPHRPSEAVTRQEMCVIHASHPDQARVKVINRPKLFFFWHLLPANDGLCACAKLSRLTMLER